MLKENSAYWAKSAYRGDLAKTYELRQRKTRFRRFCWEKESRIVENVLKQIPDEWTVLDLPCGTGRVLPLLKAKGCKFMAGDISRDMIKEAPGAPDLGPGFQGFTLCDAESLPLRDESVDYIVSMKFLHLLPEATVATVMREFARICARGMVVEIPLLQPVSPAVKLALKLIRPKTLGLFTNSTKQANITLRSKDFRRLVESMNLRIAATYHPTWIGGHTKILVLEKNR